MKKKGLASLLTIIVLVSTITCIRLPNKLYIGDYLMGGLGLKFSRVVSAITVVVAFYFAEKQCKKYKLKSLFQVLVTSFTILAFITLITQNVF